MSKNILTCLRNRLQSVCLCCSEVCDATHHLSSTRITDGPLCGGAASTLVGAVSMMAFVFWSLGGFVSWIRARFSLAARISSQWEMRSPSSGTSCS